MLPGDGYDSYKGVWKPPEEGVYYHIDHVFEPEHTSGSLPTEAGGAPIAMAAYPMDGPADSGQHLKFVQQGLLDTERSLTQLQS